MRSRNILLYDVNIIEQSSVEGLPGKDPSLCVSSAVASQRPTYFDSVSSNSQAKANSIPECMDDLRQ